MPASIPLSTWLLLLPQLAGASQLLPTAIRKMPPDRNAKFHHEYCAFADPDEDQLPAALLARRFSSSSNNNNNNYHQPQWSNTSTPISPFPPFALLASSSSSGHNDDPAPWFLFRRAKVALERRQWACPVGTESCASIGFPNSCCGQDETCIPIDGGPLGCCPAGVSCSGGVRGCAAGSVACPSELGGGCCLEGFVCEGVGCVPYIPPKPTLTTLTTTSTTILSDPTPSTVIITVVTTVTPAPDPITSTTTSTTTVRPTDDTEPGAPLRPTSSAPEPTNPTNDNGDNNNNNDDDNDDDDDDDNSNTSRYCPTGFYPCHARAGGGCCPSGRGCDTATCPPVAVTTTIVNANGVTVVMPLNEVPAEATPTQGSCAKGWYLCGGDKKNKGCCPDGYACGVASCFLTAAGETRGVRPGEGQAASLGGRGWGWVLGVGLVALAGWA